MASETRWKEKVLVKYVDKFYCSNKYLGIALHFNLIYLIQTQNTSSRAVDHIVWTESYKAYESKITLLFSKKVQTLHIK